MFRTIVGIGINKNMLPWKDSSLWSWPQTLPFASQRFSENLIERLHSSLPPSMGSFCIPPVRTPILWYCFFLRNSNFKHFWPSTKFIKSKGHLNTHITSPPIKKKQHVPTPNFRPSTYRLRIINFTHIATQASEWNFSTVGSTGISWTHQVPSQSIAEVLGTQWKEVW